MTDYVNPGEQLVVALYVRDIKESCRFYREFGFEVSRDEGTFMELKWEEALLFLVEKEGAPDSGSPPVGNLRVMVSEVDDYWTKAKKMKAEIILPIDDRYYGLRDFIIAGPGGLALRFATLIQTDR
jgi:catechol 2,3-dioxygenase-like lactoylglutathione lyase family enzyme